MSRCTVLLASAEFLGREALVQALVNFQKIPFQDAARRARSCWGFIADDLEPAAAQACLQQLQSVGLEGVAVAQEAILPLPAAELLSKAEWGRTGLTVFPSGKPSHTLEWNTISLVALGAFQHTTTTTAKVEKGPSPSQKWLNAGLFMATGLPIKLGGSTRVVSETRQSTDLLLYVDLFADSQRWRIDAQHFDYSGLKERKLFHGLGNLKVLLSDWTSGAAHALQNRGTRIFLKGEPVRSMGYDSLDDLERESRWLLTLRSLKRL